VRPSQCEIARFLKLTNTSVVEPLSFIVPRKVRAPALVFFLPYHF
jgi:hypothetical protein